MNIKTYDELIEHIKIKSLSNKIYIWGIGIYGVPLGGIFNDLNINWNGYYTNEKPETNECINCKEVKVFSENMTLEKDAVYILTMRLYESVKKQLLSKNISIDNIIYFDNTEIFYTIGNRNHDIISIKSEVKKFEAINKDKRCFIIGNGPSLTIEDLNILEKNKEISFACNDIYRCFDITKWRPTYYFAIDKYYDLFFNTNKGRDVLRKLSEDCKKVFIRCGVLCDEDLISSNICALIPKYSTNIDCFDFSNDMSEGYYMGYTVAYCMMQMAVYMGVENIYLIGMDHNYDNKNNGGHSDILKNYSPGNNNYIELWNKSYCAAKKYTDEHSVKIYNATRGGKLEIFPRVDFDSLFNNV